jgi:hypothetical protein
MLFSLIVVTVGAIVLAGWATMMASRSLSADAAIDAQRRRIIKANGRALARQYLLSSLANGSTIDATNFSATSLSPCEGYTNHWGGFTNAATVIDILTTTTANTNAYNPFSPGERQGFQNTITGSVKTADETNSWSFRVRGRSPIYAGYPLVVQLNADTVSANVSVPSNSALLWTNSATMDFTSQSYQSSTNLPLLAGGGSNLSPFPYAPLASESPADALSYNGTIATTPIAAGMSVITDDSATVADGITITSNATLQTVALDLGVKNLTSSGNATSILILYQVNAGAGVLPIALELTGGAAASAALPALHILYQEEAGTHALTSIKLIGDNSRRTYLSIIKNSPSASVNITSTASQAWKGGMLFQNYSSTWSLGGTLTLTGGIRSDANLSVPAGSIVLRADTDPGGLEALADRMVWLEENQTE